MDSAQKVRDSVKQHTYDSHAEREREESRSTFVTLAWLACASVLLRRVTHSQIRGLFRAWFAGLSGAALDAKILEVFQQFDTDNSGYLEFDEFKMACEKMGLSLADEDLKALVREFDQDGDEQISFDEFRHAVKVWISQWLRM